MILLYLLNNRISAPLINSSERSAVPCQGTIVTVHPSKVRILLKGTLDELFLGHQGLLGSRTSSVSLPQEVRTVCGPYLQAEVLKWQEGFLSLA